MATIQLGNAVSKIAATVSYVHISHRFSNTNWNTFEDCNYKKNGKNKKLSVDLKRK